MISELDIWFLLNMVLNFDLRAWYLVFTEYGAEFRSQSSVLVTSGKANLVSFWKANFFIFYSKAVVRKHTSTTKNTAKDVLHQTDSSFFCSSVSYFNTIYSKKKKKLLNIPKHCI